MVRKGYLIALVVTVTLFSAVKYNQAIKEKQQLLKEVDLIRNKLSILENERKDLIQDLSHFVKSEREDLIQGVYQLNSKLVEAKKTIKQLQLTIALLEEEKSILDQEVGTLRNKNLSLEFKNQNLEARLNSLKELKKAIRDIKRKMSLVKRQIKKRIDGVAIGEGNQGYLVKDGKSTFEKRVKIRVIPIESKD